MPVPRVDAPVTRLNRLSGARARCSTMRRLSSSASSARRRDPLRVERERWLEGTTAPRPRSASCRRVPGLQPSGRRVDVHVVQRVTDRRTGPAEPQPGHEHQGEQCQASAEREMRNRGLLRPRPARPAPIAGSAAPPEPQAARDQAPAQASMTRPARPQAERDQAAASGPAPLPAARLVDADASRPAAGWVRRPVPGPARPLIPAKALRHLQAVAPAAASAGRRSPAHPR